jgi:hypothetical protein
MTRAVLLPAVPRPRALACLIVAILTIGLAVDRVAGMPGQIAVSLVVWAVLTTLALRLPAEIGRRLVACTWISGLGELVASLGWGLYDYQFGNVPLFVPPGHALLYLLGLIVAPSISARFSRGLLVVLAPLVLALAVSGLDLLSLPLFALFAVFILRGRHHALYAVMFLLALLLELYGTALGNWAWRPVAPGTGLTTMNPPLAAGVFYCGLDWLVNRFVGARRAASC